jgi:hypothetical protein
LAIIGRATEREVASKATIRVMVVREMKARMNLHPGLKFDSGCAVVVLSCSFGAFGVDLTSSMTDDELDIVEEPIGDRRIRDSIERFEIRSNKPYEL